MMSSSSSEGASTSSSNRVHFTMTVKVDIEAPTATATAPTISSSSSSSTICAAAAAAASATAAGTQDLLLKLQPLLPHLCIAAPRDHHHQQQQELMHQHQDPVSTQQLGGGGGGDRLESGLELSLGLSSFTQSGVSSSPPSPPREEEQERDDRVAIPAALESRSSAANVGSGRHPSLARSDSLPVDWRVLEQQRLKREVQCQKRQEARKKRRILIEEQKLQRRRSSAAGTTSSSHHSKKKPAVKQEADEDPSHEATKATRSSGGRGHSHAGRKSKKGMDSSPATLNSSSGNVLKADASDATATATARGGAPNTCTTSGPASVIRPSPVHEPKNEWIDKILEMRKMVRSDGGEANLPDDQQPLPQFSSVSSSSVAIVVASSGSLAYPVASSSATTGTTAAMEHKVVISSREDGDLMLPPPPPPPPPPPTTPPPPSLLRSASLGRQEHLLLQQQQQQQQRSCTLRAPSPVRCNSSLMRTLSEGAAMRSSMGSSVGSWSRRSSTSSAFRSPKKQEQQEQQVDGGMGCWEEDPEAERRRRQAAAMVARSSSSSAAGDLPWVTTTGPNGKTVTGVLFAYKKGEVKIVCACHGRHMSAKEFVEHAGGVDVSNPEKCIVVSPVKRSMTPCSTI